MAIRIFVTGGTFDKEYNEIDGKLFFKESHIHEILKLGRCKVDFVATTLMMVDSLDMSDADRAKICENCQSCAEDRLVITHGTDTMVETAKVLGQAKLNKTIILTGALIPYKFGSSDGLFNLGCAVGFVQALPAGVYIAMNGRFFNWDNVVKNRVLGQFEEVRGA
jgi:L-asparaginase